MHRISGLAIALLGVVHVAYTTIEYPAWSAEAAWFAGTGVGLTVLGLFNLVVDGKGPRQALRLCFAANLFTFVYMIALASVVAEVQAFFAVLPLLLASIATAHSLFRTGPIASSV